MPKYSISVIMSVYNTEEEYLRAAIESILNQTFSDFEFIIVLDCPTDNSEEIVREYAQRDQRVKVIANATNLGLTKSLNVALAAATGKYIARMDADDVSLPIRFEKQFNYMEEHPEIAALGSRAYIQGTETPVQYEWVADQDVLKIRMMFRNCGLPHPSAFIRKEMLDKNGVKYTEAIKKSQDYKLWVDLLPYGEIVMYPEILLMYRVHDKQISAQKSSQMQYAHEVTMQQVLKLLEVVTEQEQELHFAVMGDGLPQNDVQGLSRHLDKLLRANAEKKIYDQKKMKREIKYLWCRKAWRMAVLEKNFKMLLHPKSLALLSPEIIGYTKENKQHLSAYIDQIRKINAEGAC